MVTQTLQCDQIFKVLNMFPANYLSVEARRMEPPSLSSVASGREARSSHGARNLSTRAGEAGAAGRGEPPPGEAGAELEMTTEALAGEPETWILGSTSAPSYLQPRLGLAFSGLQDSFPVVFPQRPKDHILVVGGRGSGRTRGFANQASKTERPGFKSYLCHPAAV